ncbi:MAG TPA: hypothetical protein DCZ72_00035, partial [Armatimonadetes bacterium]|nr:hypothetical protein [Armatimonadota bacterium]
MAFRVALLTLGCKVNQADSGTGKEVFAQAIHNGSLRNNGPFVAINC